MMYRTSLKYLIAATHTHHTQCRALIFLCFIFISVCASFLNVKYFWLNVVSWHLEKQVAWRKFSERNADWSGGNDVWKHHASDWMHYWETFNHVSRSACLICIRQSSFSLWTWGTECKCNKWIRFARIASFTQWKQILHIAHAL